MKLSPVIALLILLVGGTVQAYFPLVTTGDPAPAAYPQRMELPAPSGYDLVPGATPFIVCAPDGTLRLSAFALREWVGDERSQGLTVFRVDPQTLTLTELPEYRPATVTRGGLAGLSIRDCGLLGVVAVYIENNAFIVVQGR
jgi:hypothetical protein